MTEQFGFFGVAGNEARFHDRTGYVRSLRQSNADATSSEYAKPERKIYLRGPSLHAGEGVLTALTGSPQLRSGDEITTLDAAGIGRQFEERGEALFGDLHGPFSLAIADPRSETCWLAVDRMGIERMAYSHLDGGLVFSDSVDAIAHFPGSPATFRDQSLFEYVFFHMIPAPQSAFVGVNKLEAGQFLRFRGGTDHLQRYWSPDFRRSRATPEAELAHELHDALEQSVRACGPDESSGAFLSGGLDSSTVAGKLSAVAEQPAKTFSIGFDLAEYDELPYARIAAKRFGCEAHEYNVVASDIIELIGPLADAYDEPFGNSSAIPTFHCARFAKQHGVDHLLAGDGGDELFAGNERYARQRVFGLYGRLPGPLRSALLEPAARLIAEDSALTPLRKFRSYVDQARIPLPDRFETWNFVYREGTDKLFADEFVDSINLDGPVDMMRTTWSDTDTTSLIDHMLWYDWKFTLADNDLRKVRRMCDLAGVRVSFPMLDPLVVNLSTRVPDKLKMHRFQLRSFYKRAMQGFLPDQILNKQKHGFGLPFGAWLKTDLQLADLVYSNISDLKSRSVFNASFIDRLIEDQRQGHASYYGYVIWDLMVLEEWLKRHVDNRCEPASAA